MAHRAQSALEQPAITVLDAGSPSMRTLGDRLRKLGYRVLPCKTPDHAERLLRTRRGVTAFEPRPRCA